MIDICIVCTDSFYDCKTLKTLQDCRSKMLDLTIIFKRDYLQKNFTEVEYNNYIYESSLHKFFASL